MPMTVALRDYQVADLAYYIPNPKCMNLSNPGTGKTPSVCVMQWYLWSELQVKTGWDDAQIAPQEKPGRTPPLHQLPG